MGKLNILVAGSNNKFTTDDKLLFERAAHAANEFISNNFNFDYDVDIVITAPSFLMSTIPEDGIGARTYNSHLIILVIDKERDEITEDIVFETICHEMSHSLRFEKLPEYSRTMFEVMVFEGLAVVLEEKAMSDTDRHKQQYFLSEMQNVDQATIDASIAQLSDSFKNEQYDYDTVFFTGNNSLPRWTGYKLGYYFVKKYLEQTGTTIEQATIESYKKIKP